MNNPAAIRFGLVSGAHVLLIAALLHTVQTTPPLPPKDIVVTLEAPLPKPVVAPPQPRQQTPPPPQPAPRPVPHLKPVIKPIAPVPVAKPDEVATEPTPSRPEPVAPPPAPAAPAKATEPAPVSQPRVDANASGNVKPAYPSISRKLGEEGRVMLEVMIQTDGSVADIRIKQSSGFARLDHSALDAVRRWKFTPARQGGQAIAMWYALPIVFSLNTPD